MLPVTWFDQVDTGAIPDNPLLRASPASSVTKRQRRGHGRPTLHDVAAEAGVTRITVSRFLRTPQLLAEDTATRVREAIERIGYVPNQQAGQLASGRSRIVAALVPNLGYSVFAETVQGLSDGLFDSGYELMLMCTGYSLLREEQQLRALLGWSPSAVVVTGRRHTPAAQKLLHETQDSGVPVVEIWDRPAGERASPEQALALIGFDHCAIGALMAQHLLDLGHRHLAYLDSAVADDYRAHERQDGFVAHALAAGASINPLQARAGDPFEAGRAALHQLRARHPQVTGVAFANDLLAGGVLHEASTLGSVLPGDLSLLGFGDFPLGRQLRPALSTVHTPNAEIGRLAAQTVLKALLSGERPQSLTLTCDLLQRDSTAPPCTLRG